KVKSPYEYFEKIKIGKDGLIITNGVQSGLLLPQVPIEYGWNVKTFLEHLCMKAFLPPDAWKYEGSDIFRFNSEIFGEKEPRGKIE
ncbi:MAG: TIGR00296 family protein, partial [Candidatus Aenigmarchaeota archaeon]|nr:TIGR00296 family protein [Candidatus Aenigmarchaeota archaeon]NIQ17712.1 TIGR00296 family protein [Candidatus Aenigmarchaeota archaeon]NIS73334.1 TIGR00296 family protein [Candidatus Aenigmarchaeota archaeon]